jgi:ATP-binding cassette subfamily B protein
MAIYNISFELGLVLVLIVGGLLIEAGTLTVTAYMLLLVFAILFYEPLPLMDYTTMKRFSKTTIHHLNDIITPQDMTEPTGAQAKQPAGHAIGFDHVTFGYDPAVPVIHDLSLTIPEHGTVAIIGPSGGGKTTLLSLIARFWDVQQGAVTIGGVDVRDMTEHERMQKLAFVFQDVYLFNDTVANNIRYGKPNATMEEVILAARKARCHEFITALPEGYETNVGSGGNLLSGGQKQRISIARAILKEAEVVLLDEATASVDPDNEHYIHAAMAEMARDKTVVVVAHRLNTIAQADMIVVVDNGRIVQAGNHRELIARAGIYRTFWESRRTASHWVMERPATGDLPHAKVDL